MILLDSLYLFFLGGCGWLILKKINFPVPGLLGGLLVVSILRLAQFPIPESPGFLPYLAQLIIGIYIGTKLTRESVKQLKTMLLPGILIIVWALLIAFGLGTFVARVTNLDLYTGILSCSMGGLPEMTVIALDTKANIAMVIIVQLIRLLLTLACFPLILKFYGFYNNNISNKHNSFTVISIFNDIIGIILKLNIKIKDLWKCVHTKNIYDCIKNFFYKNVKCSLYTLLIAISGGFLLSLIGISAGTMVGAMIFVAIASLLGVQVKQPPFILFELMLIGIGILVSENINQDTINLLLSGEIFYPILICISVIAFTSIIVALIIKKITDWNIVVCFLAASPAGLSAMIAISVELEESPFKVSMMQLCRLITLKTVVPFAFLFI